MIKDLTRVVTKQDFRELMISLNKQIEHVKELETKSRPSSHRSYDGDMLDHKTSDKGPKQVILWAFANVDKMKKEFWGMLESRLLDIYQS